jgi:two-component system, chemotaxis family, protein-glutamate methylesterase/glutaminase
MTKVLIIDDLKSAREMIRDILASDPELHVCAMTDNGADAIDLVKQHHPHLIILDSHLKQISGYEVAQAIMKVRPTPIVMIASAGEAAGQGPVRAFDYGVLEVIQKQDLYRWRTQADVAAGFIRKVKLMSRVSSQSIRRHVEAGAARAKAPDPAKKVSTATRHREIHQDRIIAIVASTGGPNALFQILRSLPAGFPAPIVMVQHMSPGFIHGLAEWLNHDGQIPVRVAEDNEALVPGRALLAPDNAHLTVTGKQRIKLDLSPPVGGHRPSGNLLFASAGNHYGSRALGVLLTGMGNDGAQGMAALKAAGGETIAQDEGTSVIFGMPRTAIQMGVVDHVLPLSNIAAAIEAFVRTGRQDARSHG